MEEKRKYLVEILSMKGTCDSTLFEKMAKKGDITAIKVNELIGKIVTIIGYAECRIETNDKNFVINYYDTKEFGLISSGSEIFKESVEDYFGEVETVRITEIKTKKGKTYKAVPELKNTNKKEEKEEKEEKEDFDTLPF